MSLDDLMLGEDTDDPMGCIFTVLMWLMLVAMVAWLLWSGDPLDDGQIVKAGSTSTPVIYQGEE